MLAPPLLGNSKKGGAVSARLQGKRRDILLPERSAFFWSAECKDGRVCGCSLSGSEPCFHKPRWLRGLELDADRIELIEQRRSTDPTLHHIAMALRAGVQTGAALDRMYGEGYQQRSPLISYANMARQC